MNIYFVQFQRGCRSCMQTTGIYQLIQFQGYDRFLNKNIPGSLFITDVKTLISRFYEERHLFCELCGSINQFDFYDITVNDVPVKKSVSHKHLLDANKKLIIKYKTIKNVFVSDSNDKDDCSISFENKGGLLELSSSYIKIYDTAAKNTLMREVFEGEIRNINFYPNEDIQEIQGITKHWLNGNFVNFYCLTFQRQLGKYFTQDDHFYLVLDPKYQETKTQTNLLLETLYEFFILDKD